MQYNHFKTGTTKAPQPQPTLPCNSTFVRPLTLTLSLNLESYEDPTKYLPFSKCSHFVIEIDILVLARPWPRFTFDNDGDHFQEQHLKMKPHHHN